MEEGNARFMRFEEARPNQDPQRRFEITLGQEPVAAVLACSDSRVPVEMIFDQGLGDIFVIRTAGEIIDLAVLGSLEYAVDSLHVPLIVVMGHESCGAVAATRNALDGHALPSGYQRVVVEKVTPSILEARAAGRESIQQLEEQHVAETVDMIIERSPSIRAKVARGTLGVVGVRYRLSDGHAQELVQLGLSG